jgi:pyrrolidone-carboxylate peptidase
MSAAPTRSRVIVTGFGDFDRYSQAEGAPNPSGLLAFEVAQLAFPGASLQARRLPVTHRAVHDFIAELREAPPDVVLSLGVGPTAQVELWPENWSKQAVDGEGVPISEGPIDPARPPRDPLRSPLPATSLERALRRAVRAGALPHRTLAQVRARRPQAHETGAYLCNFLNYALVDSFAADPRTLAGFVHITAHTCAPEIAVVLRAMIAHQRHRGRTAAALELSA